MSSVTSSQAPFIVTDNMYPEFLITGLDMARPPGATRLPQSPEPFPGERSAAPSAPANNERARRLRRGGAAHLPNEYLAVGDHVLSIFGHGTRLGKADVQTGACGHVQVRAAGGVSWGLGGKEWALRGGAP